VRCPTRVRAAAAGSATLHIALSNIAASTLHVASDDEDDVDEYAAFSSKNASACLTRVIDCRYAWRMRNRILKKTK
jgi:hypothetical protein